jgi:hypothetical protein
MARPIMALIVSYLLVGVLGCAFLLAYWTHLGSAWLGVVRSVAFVVIMGGVHFVGYRLWKRQGAATIEQAEAPPSTSIWQAYGDAIKAAVAQQVVILLLASLVLDGGLMLRMATLAAAGSWAFNIVIVARRPRSPTPTDVLIVKYGFWLAALVSFVLAPIMGRTF